MSKPEFEAVDYGEALITSYVKVAKARQVVNGLRAALMAEPAEPLTEPTWHQPRQHEDEVFRDGRFIDRQWAELEQLDNACAELNAAHEEQLQFLHMGGGVGVVEVLTLQPDQKPILAWDDNDEPLGHLQRAMGHLLLPLVDDQLWLQPQMIDQELHGHALYICEVVDESGHPRIKLIA